MTKIHAMMTNNKNDEGANDLEYEKIQDPDEFDESFFDQPDLDNDYQMQLFFDKIDKQQFLIEEKIKEKTLLYEPGMFSKKMTKKIQNESISKVKKKPKND